MRVTMSGTSMAAPHVTGIVALLFERAQTMARPTLLTAEQTRKLIMATTSIPLGVQVFDPAWGFGRIDAEAAVKLLE
jgi:subtilisin family serine protease